MKDASPLVRGNISDDADWEALVALLARPNDMGFMAQLDPVDEPQLRDMNAAALLKRFPGRSLILVADAEAAAASDHPVLCIDGSGDPSQSFRCVSSELWSVENNLRLANMDFEEFAACAGEDGMFRGF